MSLIHACLGTEPATQACALTGNRTGDWRPFALRDDIQPTEPHRSGLILRVQLLKLGTVKEGLGVEEVTRESLGGALDSFFLFP